MTMLTDYTDAPAKNSCDSERVRAHRAAADSLRDLARIALEDAALYEQETKALTDTFERLMDDVAQTSRGWGYVPDCLEPAAILPEIKRNQRRQRAALKLSRDMLYQSAAHAHAAHHFSGEF